MGTSTNVQHCATIKELLQIMVVGWKLEGLKELKYCLRQLMWVDIGVHALIISYIITFFIHRNFMWGYILPLSSKELHCEESPTKSQVPLVVGELLQVIVVGCKNRGEVTILKILSSKMNWESATCHLFYLQGFGRRICKQMVELCSATIHVFMPNEPNKFCPK